MLSCRLAAARSFGPNAARSVRLMSSDAPPPKRPSARARIVTDFGGVSLTPAKPASPPPAQTPAKESNWSSTLAKLADTPKPAAPPRIASGDMASIDLDALAAPEPQQAKRPVQQRQPPPERQTQRQTPAFAQANASTGGYVRRDAVQQQRASKQQQQQQQQQLQPLLSDDLIEGMSPEEYANFDQELNDLYADYNEPKPDVEPEPERWADDGDELQWDEEKMTFFDEEGTEYAPVDPFFDAAQYREADVDWALPTFEHTMEDLEPDLLFYRPTALSEVRSVRRRGQFDYRRNMPVSSEVLKKPVGRLDPAVHAAAILGHQASFNTLQKERLASLVAKAVGSS